MPKIRDPKNERGFNFVQAGEWVEVPADNVPYLVETYGVEVEEGDSEE